jgi:CubicO group peptidase (beta-lactamase class C family)
MARLKLSIDPAKVAAHVIRPENVKKVTSSRGLDGIQCPQVEFLPGRQYQFDADAFADALDAHLKDSVIGYVMQLRQNGATLKTGHKDGAKIPPDGPQDWTSDVRMHIASCSKLLTAIAMTKLLYDKNLSPDTPIIDYLPRYWDKGLNVDMITFRHLMTHTSGFNAGALCDFLTMKSVVAAGVNDHGRHASDNDLGYYRYENMNFGICRILIAVINGDIFADAQWPPPPDDLNDRWWDLTTIEAYAEYVREKLFTPAGVVGPTLDHPLEDALAYSVPATTHGWDSFDLKSVSGSSGWHMSANELLDVMGAFRREENILSPQQAKSMLENKFGIDAWCQTPIGKFYGKNGFWNYFDGGQLSPFYEEQAVAYFLPQDMELVVLVNSPLGPNDQSLLELVNNLYVANIKAT